VLPPFFQQIVPQIERPLSRQVYLQAQGAVPLSQMPVWTLPDDNSGLDALLRSQVRMLPSLLHGSIPRAFYNSVIVYFNHKSHVTWPLFSSDISDRHS
jgi:hypothetical protein